MSQHCQNHKATRLWIYLANSSSAHFAQKYWHFSQILLLSAILVDSNYSICSCLCIWSECKSWKFFLTLCLGNWVDWRPKGDQLLRANIRWVLLGKYITVVIIVALLGLLIERISILASQSDDDTGGGESTTGSQGRCQFLPLSLWVGYIPWWQQPKFFIKHSISSLKKIWL